MTELQLLSPKEVVKLTGISRTTLHKFRLAGKFPKAVQLSEMRIAFVKAEVEQWIKDRDTKLKKDEQMKNGFTDGFKNDAIEPRDVKLNIAIAVFQNNGGLMETALKLVEAAYKQEREGLRLGSDKGLNASSNPLHPNGNDEGLVNRSDEDTENLPTSLPPHKDDVKKPSSSPNLSREGSFALSNKAARPFPSPASAQKQSILLESRNGTSLSVLETFKVRGGKSIGQLTIGEVRELHAVNATEAYVMQRILHHYSNAPSNKTVSELFKADQIKDFIEGAKHESA